MKIWKLKFLRNLKLWKIKFLRKIENKNFDKWPLGTILKKGCGSRYLDIEQTRKLSRAQKFQTPLMRVRLRKPNKQPLAAEISTD